MEYGTIEKNNELNVGARRFIFDTVISEEYTRQADITDQYVENNSTIQDHYAIKPAELTIKGFVAEVTYQREDSQFLEEELKKAQEEAKVRDVGQALPDNSLYYFCFHFVGTRFALAYRTSSVRNFAS